ncbi:MAG: methyltransferase family protein [Phycisphaerae bacterium]
MLMLPRLSAAASGLWVLIYWGTVIIKAVRLSRKIGKDPNVLPREKTGRSLRLLWTPAIVAWCILPWVSAFRGFAAAWYLRALWPMTAQTQWIGVVATLVGLLALILTFVCWRQMGRSWRIGIDPGEKTELIILGAYRIVRHPIYALSIILMLCTFLTVPTLLMLATALIHITLITLEALREEQYLREIHGAPYAAYCARTGRFIPRVFRAPLRDLA